jgi:N,N-dimethylformamidase
MEADSEPGVNLSKGLYVSQLTSLTRFEQEVDTALYRLAQTGENMLIGYVSDEYYRALHDALIELRQGQQAWTTKSAASGAIRADVPPGTYEAIVAKPGYGSKRIASVDIGGGSVIQIRLLSDRMLGMVWPQWSRGGEEVEFRIHSIEPVNLTLWRYGLERSPVRRLGWLDDHGPRAMAQVLPDDDFTQTGVMWFGGNMKVHSQVIIAPEETGLYFFRMKGESGAYFSFPLIVAPASPCSRLAVVANTNTWNAYNAFGGRSNYVQPGGLRSEPTVNARQDLSRYLLPDYGDWKSGKTVALSFVRPNPWNSVAEYDELTAPIEGRLESTLAPGEWRTLGWLEREGFPYDLYSDYQLHAGELPLEKYQALLLHVHPEYWSVEAYDRVKDWVNHGGKLIYLGGNGMNGPVEVLEEARVLHRNQMSDSLESRMHVEHESEANLLGVVFTESGAMTSAPYEVVNASHWVFEGTGLSAGGQFGSRTLHQRCPNGASGHETDKRSQSTPPQAVLLARGLNPQSGGAEMIWYELPGGGCVFSVGSITFAPSLLVDSACSQITTNVLHRVLA